MARSLMQQGFELGVLGKVTLDQVLRVAHGALGRGIA